MGPIPDGVSATTAWVDSHNESKSFKIIWPCRSVRSSISLYIGHSLGNNYPLANLPPRDSACHQFFQQCASNFNYRVWPDFRTSQHIGGLEYIIRSKMCCLFSVLFIFETCNTVFVHHVPFLLSVIWYDRGQYRLFISLPAFSIFFEQMQRIINHNSRIFVFLLHRLSEFLRLLVCIWSKTQNGTQRCIMTQIHTIPVAIVWPYQCYHWQKRHIWTAL